MLVNGITREYPGPSMLSSLKIVFFKSQRERKFQQLLAEELAKTIR